MPVSNLRELLIHELKDIYNAEKQITKALPKMVKAADSAELQQGFKEHLEVTQGQIERLEQCFEHLGASAGRMKCHGMEGLIEEGQELIDEVEPPAADAGLIAGAQKIEHYEIAAYGSVRTWAELLGEDEVARLLEETLEEEKEMDQRLNQLAEQLNVEAEQEEDEEEEIEEQPAQKAASKRGGKAARGR